MSVRLAIAQADLSTLNVSEFCRDHGISRDRFYAIRRRFDSEGEAGLEPRSRAPHQVASRTPAAVEDRVVWWRKKLVEDGNDAGPASIWDQLCDEAGPGVVVPSEATIWRILTRRGFIVPQPSKAPPRVWRRFTAERANECWQIDPTPWELADGTGVEIINIIDDCTRVWPAALAVASATTAACLEAIARGAEQWGWPERFLADNARYFHGHPDHGGGLAAALAPLGIDARRSRPYHPQTCGKVERFHQTLKQWLEARDPAPDLETLQAQLNEFADHYNHYRRHRGIDRQIPAQLWTNTAKSGPTTYPINAPTRVLRTTVSADGAVWAGPYRIAVGIRHHPANAITIITGTAAHVFIGGRLIRKLTVDPDRQNYPQRART